MKTLYCFKLDEKTGKIQRYDITDYKVNEHKYLPTTRSEYIFTGKFGTQGFYKYRIRFDKLDRFAGNKVFTFNSSAEYAYNIIHHELSNKVSKAESDIRRYKLVLAMLRPRKDVEESKE